MGRCGHEPPSRPWRDFREAPTRIAAGRMRDAPGGVSPSGAFGDGRMWRVDLPAMARGASPARCYFTAMTFTPAVEAPALT